MKQLKKISLMLVALITAATGAWAQTENEVTVTTVTKGKQWTFTMPASNVELTPIYDPELTALFKAGNSNTIQDGKATVSVTEKDGTTAYTGATFSDGGKYSPLYGEQKITLTAAAGYKFKSVEVKKKVAKPDLLSGVFSVDVLKKVYFSKGNLRYASGAWSFFDNQYDYYTSYSENAWDKFGWSTFANTYGMSTSTTSSDYSDYFVDWGSNSDLQTALGTGWFTLSSEEWTYLFNTRSASTVGGTADGRYAKAKVNGVQGVILFPDTYTHPDGVTPPTGVNATGNTGWNGNNYSSADWTKMESAGCVFLPAAGYRNGSSVYSLGTGGNYWSSTLSGTDNAYNVYFYSGSLYPADIIGRYNGYSVRLVWEVAE